MIAPGAQALNGGDPFAGGIAHRKDATPHRLSLDVHGAGAAQTHPATELRAGQIQQIAQIPQQWHGGIAVKLPGGAIYGQFNHVLPLFHGPEAGTSQMSGYFSMKMRPESCSKDAYLSYVVSGYSSR